MLNVTNRSTTDGRKTNLDVSTLERQSKARLLVLDKVQRNLRIAFLLEIGDDGLADELRVSHHVQHLVVLPVDERQLELVFRRIDAENARAAFAVEAVDAVALDPGDVDRKVEGPYYAVVAKTAARGVQNLFTLPSGQTERDTVKPRHIEVRGAVKNTSKYPRFVIS